MVFFQLKAAESLQPSGSAFVFDLDVRDFHLWMNEKMPVILILFDASRRKAYWLPVKEYFRKDATRQPKKGAKTVRVYVPKRSIISRRAIATMRALLREAISG
jgi:hypothetical protein